MREVRLHRLGGQVSVRRGRHEDLEGSRLFPGTLSYASPLAMWPLIEPAAPGNPMLRLPGLPGYVLLAGALLPEGSGLLVIHDGRAHAAHGHLRAAREPYGGTDPAQSIQQAAHGHRCPGLPTSFPLPSPLCSETAIPAGPLPSRRCACASWAQTPSSSSQTYVSPPSPELCPLVLRLTSADVRAFVDAREPAVHRRRALQWAVCSCRGCGLARRAM